MKKILIPALILIVSACSDHTEPNTELSETPVVELEDQLEGTWSNIYLNLQVNYAGLKDSIKVTEVNERNWLEKLGIKPIITTFKKGGTYESKYFNINDSLVRNPKGNWAVDGDTLIMSELPEGTEYRLHLSFAKSADGKSSIARFKGMMDFDMDGSKDDMYYGEQRKQ